MRPRQLLRRPGWDGKDTLWGYVTGLGMGHPEFGAISLGELQRVKGRFGLGIERDQWWDDKITLGKVMATRGQGL